MGYRDAVQPTITEEVGPGNRDQRRISHPAFATCRVSRVSGRASLFDSNIMHDAYITMSFTTAYKYEDAYGSRVHGDNKAIFEVAMTENQFVAMITRMNVGSGVPVTVQHRQTGPMEVVPSIAAFESSEAKLKRLAGTISKHVETGIHADAAKLREILSKLPKKTQEEASKLLDHLTNTSIRNMEYGTEVLQESADQLVTEAKVEINAFATGLATELGVATLQDAARIAQEARDRINDKQLGVDPKA